MDKNDYEKYLESPWWKVRRNRALSAANWKCSRCPARRNLEVHHLTYERLGSELDSDLEVLCQDCHTGHHLSDMADSSFRVYLKLASSALRDQPFADLGDLAETVKRQCVRLKIAYDHAAIDRALSMLAGSSRLATPLPKTHEDIAQESGRPLTHAESRECLHRLGIGTALIKTMPGATVAKIDIYGDPPEEDFSYEVF